MMIRLIVVLSLFQFPYLAQPRNGVSAANKQAVQQARESYFSEESDVWQAGLKSASALYEKSLQVNSTGPLAARAAVGLGVVCLMREDARGALRRFQKASALDPQSFAVVSMWMALARWQEGKPGLADRLFWDAITHQDPGNASFTASMKQTYKYFLEEQSRMTEFSQIDPFVGYDLKPQTEEVLGVGPGIQKPRIRFRIEPDFGEQMHSNKLKGSIPVSAEVHPDGRPRKIRLLRSLGRDLDERVRETIYQWRFQPGTRNGKPAIVETVIELNFRMF